MIYNLPIEPLPERYSTYWLKDVGQQLAREGAVVTQVLGAAVTDRINNGEFLDVTGTLIWKATQMERLLRYIQAGEVNDDDVIFLHDLWYPGLEALFYARQGLGLKFKIAGMLHAGTYDPNDWTTRMQMQRWGRELENAWFHEIDMIFVASLYHAEMLRLSRSTRSNVMVTMSFPRAWDAQLPQAGQDSLLRNTKQKIVVWPHRMAPEKDPDKFRKAAAILEQEFPEWQFICTKDICKSKEQYYQLLLHSKIAVSTAKQETWGIAMREAVLAGCVPLVPDTLAYPETFPPFLYSEGDDYEFVTALRSMIQDMDGGSVERQVVGAAQVLAEEIRKQADAAVPRMLGVMRNRGWKV